ncbi:DNA polymerase delta, subunit 4-domain-containing protein [Hypoxylon trugodes]|uniref:DNA polymerase delta, subunit 4-domain-containing protein n=1 Tax=Hypoxylon trugodes TaxID=326681 RepID=UPI00219A693D|nr:DNA polymerase delta, subunit 4-domain-containing protein [Hypoxylon trugodes]KAI1389052.1 DNA polymerase delta, subunit 4-domain-containing protein [Hypoxylon trugodes]
MPTTRRSSGGGRGATATGRQSTLSFNHRVTKPVPKSAKDLVSKPAKQSPLGKHISSAQPSPTPEDEDSIKEEIKDEEEVEARPRPEEKPKSEAELRADKITDCQIDQYWRKLERERIASRVHQEDLTLAEKVLRYWDVSSQYGPCVGISRMKRWMRADKLGLNPPLEVLAVLQKEEAKGTGGIEKAHMDEILNSTSIGSV